MQRVNIAREHWAELACHRIDARVCRGSRHWMFERERAGDGKRPQPREASGKIAEPFTEENAWCDQVGCIGSGSLRARVANPPAQSPRHQRLMGIVAVNLALDRKIGCIEPRTPGAAPIAVNPSAIDTDSERLSEDAKKGPTKPLIDDVAPLVGMLGA